jgi:hypothetical protein
MSSCGVEQRCVFCTRGVTFHGALIVGYARERGQGDIQQAENLLYAADTIAALPGLVWDVDEKLGAITRAPLAIAEPA